LKPDTEGAREVLEHGPAVDWPRYECTFCRHRSDEKSAACPRCGAAYGFTERATARGLRRMSAAVFALVGFGILAVSVAKTVEVLAHRARVDTRLFWPAVYGLGLFFLAGGVSAMFGRLWLLRLFMLATVGRGAPRPKSR
jgi:hypothetical protein